MMAEVSMDLVKQLRDATGAGMMDCKRALEQTQGDVEAAVTWLREKGIATAAKRAGRETTNGVVEAYLHRTSDDYPPQVGVLLELDCESDFVAKGDEFRKLARELSLHIAAAAPRWIGRQDVPPELVASERDLYRRRAEEEGKPASVLDKIVDGQLEAFFKDNCLWEQPYVREPKTPIKDLVAQTSSLLQENITVRRFSRFSIKEG
ncbi:MAG TPA: translation elongation factor Ts [Candidatus Acidoferrales bacterium]|nr:translation elongation factor Ts [Candidatus Acidoferrales bacterium]